jgi:hypothetical protein
LERLEPPVVEKWNENEKTAVRTGNNDGQPEIYTSSRVVQLARPSASATVSLNLKRKGEKGTKRVGKKRKELSYV